MACLSEYVAGQTNCASQCCNMRSHLIYNSCYVPRQFYYLKCSTLIHSDLEPNLRHLGVAIDKVNRLCGNSGLLSSEQCEAHDGLPFHGGSQSRERKEDQRGEEKDQDIWQHQKITRENFILFLNTE